jgi:pyridoxamine 5'-phosphate oxidase
MSDLAGRLRAIRVFGGQLPAFDPESVPDRPTTLFTEWLIAAIDAGAVEPHVAVLSTVDGGGRPDARALILKDVDDDGWWFASSSAGPKGAQLANNPWAALTCYWPAQGRQVRIRGEVRKGSQQDSAKDFLARATGGRAEALVGHQSQYLANQAELTEALTTAEERVTEDPSLVASDWTRYLLRAREVQFFQGDPSRKHIRVRYQFTGSVWSHSLLWP